MSLIATQQTIPAFDGVLIDTTTTIAGDVTATWSCKGGEVTVNGTEVAWEGSTYALVEYAGTERQIAMVFYAATTDNYGVQPIRDGRLVPNEQITYVDSLEQAAADLASVFLA